MKSYIHYRKVKKWQTPLQLSTRHKTTLPGLQKASAGWCLKTTYSPLNISLTYGNPFLTLL